MRISVLLTIAVILISALACGPVAPDLTSTATPGGTPVPSSTPVTSVPSATPTPKSSQTPVKTAELPAWLQPLMQRFQNEPVSNPPEAIYQYDYKGQTVYFTPAVCCDQWSTLYDAQGNVLGHPDGGITGKGDGKVTDFMTERKNEKLIWKDDRTAPKNQSLQAAPIDDLKIEVLKSNPTQYVVVIQSGLPNGCTTFAGYYIRGEDRRINIDVLNWRPTDPGTICTMIYGMVTTRVSLGSDFNASASDSVDVNDKNIRFQGGQ